jgi:hypothetical protein
MRSVTSPAVSDCRAKRWKGTPVFDGAHEAHFFTYGPHGMYTGSCIGRTEDVPSDPMPEETETKMAKLLVEVQWGIIPGTVDGNRQWGYSREEVEAAFNDQIEGETGAWQILMAPAYEEFDMRMSPAHHNWVTMTWLWL